MKCAVIFYHKNILGIYERRWIDKCVSSIKNQSHVEFDVIELNYGDGNDRFAEGIKPNYNFLEIKFDNHIGAMNYLYDLCFNNGYDVVFNTNMDDFYHPLRFQKQLLEIERGSQLVSSNFVYIDGDGVVFKKMDMLRKGPLYENFYKNHNTICHPVVAMHKSFWEDDLHYNNLLGFEDLDLWKRALAKQKRFYICDDYLCHYRIHQNQITKKHKGL